VLIAKREKTSTVKTAVARLDCLAYLVLYVAYIRERESSVHSGMLPKTELRRTGEEIPVPVEHRRHQGRRDERERRSALWEHE
jgi:hypothetical protein